MAMMSEGLDGEWGFRCSTDGSSHDGRSALDGRLRFTARMRFASTWPHSLSSIVTELPKLIPQITLHSGNNQFTVSHS